MSFSRASKLLLRFPLGELPEALQCDILSASYVPGALLLYAYQVSHSLRQPCVLSAILPPFL